MTHEISADEEVEVSIYTRSEAGARFTITDANHSHGHWLDNFEVKHTGGNDEGAIPTHEVITKEKIEGPQKLKIKADSNAGRFSTNNFLVVYAVYRK